MISIKDLKKSFGSQSVLNGVSVSFQKGEIVAILGPSGGGKSTLLRCINFLEEPDSGEIWIGDQKVNPQNLHQIRKKVGMVFQGFNLFPHFSVLENLTYAPVKVNQVEQDAADKKAQGLLDRMGLGDRKNAYPQTLSGGQKQRVAIARALMMDPEVILFDEPTSALDPDRMHEFQKVIQELASSGLTIILVTHEMSFVRNVASRILILEQGKIVKDCKPSDFN